MEDFDAPSVASAVTKVKNLLVGLPPTDAELAAVTADGNALSGLVAQWMTLPEYNPKMLAFLANAFEQTALFNTDLGPQFAAQLAFQENLPEIMENYEESFARTALELIAEGQPFTSTMSTRSFMMTPALMAAYAVADAQVTDDSGNTTDLFQQNDPTTLTLESSQPNSLAQALASADAGALTFYDPTIASPFDPACPSGTIVYPAPASTLDVQQFLLGELPAAFPAEAASDGGPTCQPPPVPATAAYLTASDFTSWKLVTIRQPQTGESTTRFYDLPTLRSATELVLNTPRVGFFTTLSFLAQWATNQSNQARVTLNQTLITGLGEPIDATNTTVPQSLAALDSTHAAPGTVCYACHQSLDPMRQFFRQAYTLSFSPQTDPAETAMPGQFAFHGVSVTGASIFDLGTQLGAHPLFATAWVQKLCTYANSAPCDESDPEFTRLVGVFKNSKFSWNALVQALFSSPIVTYLQETATADQVGQTFPISRQQHLCATLSARLGITDVCGLEPTTVVPPGLQAVQTIAASWPADLYSRGNPVPLQANAPHPFLRTGLEGICGALAQYLVDNPAGGPYMSANAPAALQSLVTTLMGLGSSRSAQPLAILQNHYTAAQQTGASASDALKSTFVLACLSPYVAGIGQ